MTVSFDDPDDRDWAIDIFRTLRPPAERDAGDQPDDDGGASE
jgi:hypothetical protein